MNKRNNDKCERIDHCLFFKDQMETMPQSTEITKDIYCRNEYEKCARYLVYIECGSEYMPKNLYPSELAMAKSVIEKCKKEIASNKSL